MSIVLFALIGATIKAGLAYWICFGVFCVIKGTAFLSKFMQVVKEDE